MPLLLGLLLLVGCEAPVSPEAASQSRVEQSGESLLSPGSQAQRKEGGSEMEQSGYKEISPQEAKVMLDGRENAILLDVRSQEEYDEGHIQGAIVIPDTEIADRAPGELSHKEATILVYCRSGRRSKLAAQILADMGYTQVYEFGGIIDWPYEIVK